MDIIFAPGHRVPFCKAFLSLDVFSLSFVTSGTHRRIFVDVAGFFDASGWLVGGPGGLLGILMTRLGATWWHLDTSRAPLVASWLSPGAFWTRLRPCLEPVWEGQRQRGAGRGGGDAPLSREAAVLW